MSPDSPIGTDVMSESFDTIENLAASIAEYANASRASPELGTDLTCCCGRPDCENLNAWTSAKSDLQNRLVLSAEVGQALLRRHELYVLRYEDRKVDRHEVYPSEGDTSTAISDLRLHKEHVEKELQHALINVDLQERTRTTLMEDLEDAKRTIKRLEGAQARSIGLDNRLAIALQHNDDLQAELDSQFKHRKGSDARITALTAYTNKMQAELKRLQEDVELRRVHRSGSLETLVQSARSTIRNSQQPNARSATFSSNPEVLEVLEKMVDENEELQRDNSELQTLLSLNNEETRALQDELDELRAQAPARAESIFSSTQVDSHEETQSIPPSAVEIYPKAKAEDLVSVLTLADQNSSLNNPDTHQSQSTQTDFQLFFGSMTSADPDSHYESLSDLRSESSSDAVSTYMSTLLDRISRLLLRMTQADALSLTNRLKRQNLKGADVEHISRSTVNGIVNELQQIRGQFPALQDEKSVTTCTRKDLRTLFKIFKDAFDELASLRIALNGIVLDPSTASRVSDMILNPTKKPEAKSTSWMAPLSKIFGTTATTILPSAPTSEPVADAPERPKSVPRPTAKQRPALAASTTTVNVEFFGGSGMGRSVTSTASSPLPQMPSTPTKDTGGTAQTSSKSEPRSMMSLWAGAPASNKVSPSAMRRDVLMRATQNGLPVGAPSAKAARRLSRVVDAVVDVTNPIADPEEANSQDDVLGPLLHRPLRRRGLSDSSIHSTYSTHAVEPPEESGSSLIQSLTQKMPSLSAIISTSPPKDSARGVRSNLRSASSLLPSMQGWSTAIGIDESDSRNPPRTTQYGSVREDSVLNRWGRGRDA